MRLRRPLLMLSCSALVAATAVAALASPSAGAPRPTRAMTPARSATAGSTSPPDGTLGIAYYRADKGEDWYVRAATAKPGQPFAAAKVSTTKIASKSNGSAFGDFFQIVFGPDSKLNIVWTLQNTDLSLDGLNTDIYLARQK